MEATHVRRDRPVLVGAILAATLLVVLVIWFGRACWGGWWIADKSSTADTYMLATVYERWAVQVKGGSLPLWFPEFGAGHPVHAGWMYGLFYPPIALFLAMPVEAAWTWLAILHVVFGALGMYAFLWDQRRDAAAAASGAVVFATSGFVLGRIECGHLNLLMPFAWAPWTLLAAARTVRGAPGASTWLGICAGLGLLAGHAQIWFYIAPLVVAFAVFEARKSGAVRAAAPRFALSATIAVGIAAIQWIPAMELFSVSGHPPEDRKLVAQCSAPFSALAAQIAPRFVVVANEFRHEFVGLAGPLAVGAALLAFRLRDGRRWFWFVVLALGLVLALGTRTELSRLANELPPFRWARAPGRSLMLVVLAGSVLAAHLVADWAGSVATRWRALAPATFLASALVFGSPAPDAVRNDFYVHDWTRALPQDAMAHRVMVLSGRAPYVENFGSRTLRDVVPVDSPGFKSFDAEGTPPEVASWWLDLATSVDTRPQTIGVPPWGAGPPPDEAATQAMQRRAPMKTYETGGPCRWFGRAVPTTDDDALARLRAGERALFVPSDTGIWVEYETDKPSQAFLPLARSTADELSFRVAMGAWGWVFLSEKWYPGWREEEGADVVRGNLAFVAVRLDHRMTGGYRLVYRPWWRVPALALSAASLLAAAAFVLRQLRRAPPSG